MTRLEHAGHSVRRPFAALLIACIALLHIAPLPLAAASGDRANHDPTLASLQATFGDAVVLCGTDLGGGAPEGQHCPWCVLAEGAALPSLGPTVPARRAGPRGPLSIAAAPSVIAAQGRIYDGRAPPR